MFTELVHGVAENTLALIRILHAQQIDRVEDNTQIPTAEGVDHFQRPIGIVHNVIPHRLDGDRDAQSLCALDHRREIMYKGIERLAAVGIGVQLILGIGGSSLGADHADAGQGRHTQIAVIARLEFSDLLGIRMCQIEITAQDGNIQVLTAKNAANISRKAFR